ncbi:MAG: IS630 family transposase [Methylococcales bacterium]
MSHKRVMPLTGKEQRELNKLMKEDANPRVRVRAEAILLSAEGYPIKEISLIKDKQVITVSRWIDQWEESKLDGLLEKEGTGCKKRRTQDEQREVEQWMDEKMPPRSAAEVATRIEKQFGKKVSTDTLRRLLKGAGKGWKRVRASLFRDRDEDSFRASKQELAEHLQASGRGEIQLSYLDESGFNDASYIRYAWQDRGSTLELPCRKGKRINVLGVLSVSDGRLEVGMPDGKMTSQIILDRLEGIAESAAREVVATLRVLDNASIHTAKVIQNQRLKWESKSLYLYFIPPYSPELNLIEILWHKIKYEWLPFDAHASFEKLQSCLNNIFSEFGNK